MGNAKGKTDYLQELVTDAVAKGARVVNTAGGTISGSFFVPAVLYPVNPKMRVYYEEQFGLVIPVLSFDKIDETIELVHDQFELRPASQYFRKRSGPDCTIDSTGLSTRSLPGQYQQPVPARAGHLLTLRGERIPRSWHPAKSTCRSDPTRLRGFASKFEHRLPQCNRC